MKSITYWNRFIYRSLMKLSYQNKFRKRYEILSSLFEENCSIVELCCGDCNLYLNYLKEKRIQYMGVDINHSFVTFARKMGIDARTLNIICDEIPRGDILLMHAGLYQFIPNERRMLDRILAASRRKVVIAEPVINRSHQNSLIISKISAFLSNPGTGSARDRFNPESFQTLCGSYKEFSHFVGDFNQTNEMIAVFKKHELMN